MFAALGKSAMHVPFRNSKLTQVLQPSLSGDAKVFIPCVLLTSVFLNTLSYFSRYDWTNMIGW